MSIEYFVEGKVITKVKGDYLVFSKGDITYNTETSVEQFGKENGVSYDKATTIHPSDKPIPLVNITLNLFFDGTLNNKTNVEAGVSYPASDGNDSFANDYSNVARGYDAIDPNAEMQIATYVEGIGSVDLKSDNDWTGQPLLGGGLGDYGRGITAKVTKGCLKSAKAISNKKQQLGNKKIDILTINVFGFSRGAAAARHFLHISSSPAKSTAVGDKIKIIAPYLYEESVEGKKTKEKEYFMIDKKYLDWIQKHGYFGACLAKNGILPQRIVFKFAGLYDTVASYGVNHREKKVIKGDTEQLGLTSVSKSYFTFQIAADDEYRDNFDLTNIDSCGVKGLEITLPGVHSDIGGGYKNGHEQSVDQYKYEIANIFKSDSKPECEAFKKILIEEGWFKPDTLIGGKLQKELSIYEVKNKMMGYNFKTHYELRGKRILSNQYEKIPLNQMLYYSQLFDVKYLQSRIKRNHEIKDAFIQKVNNQLLQYIKICNQKRNGFVEDFNNGKPTGNYLPTMKKINYKSYLSLTDLKILRNQYFHWSVNLETIAMVPRITKVEPVEKRKRNIQNG